jgi:dTDP-4-amino-4,6-dideoxygalactose transaminase
MTDIQAAIGREQLKRLAPLVARRRELAGRYLAGLRDVRGLALPHEPEWARTNWQTFAVRVSPSRQLPIMQHLLDEGISTRRGVMNVHLEAAYPAGSWRAAGALTRGEEAQASAIALPLFHDLADGQQDRIIELLPGAVATA